MNYQLATNEELLTVAYYDEQADILDKVQALVQLGHRGVISRC